MTELREGDFDDYDPDVGDDFDDDPADWDGDYYPFDEDPLDPEYLAWRAKHDAHRDRKHGGGECTCLPSRRARLADWWRGFRRRRAEAVRRRKYPDEPPF